MHLCGAQNSLEIQPYPSSVHTDIPSSSQVNSPDSHGSRYPLNRRLNEPIASCPCLSLTLNLESVPLTTEMPLISFILEPDSTFLRTLKCPLRSYSGAGGVASHVGHTPDCVSSSRAVTRPGRCKGKEGMTQTVLSQQQ